MTSKKIVTFQISLEEYNDLKIEAKKRKVSVSWLIRELISNYISKSI